MGIFTQGRIVILFVAVLIAAEIIRSWRNDKQVYTIKDTLSNLLIFAGFQFSRFLFGGYQMVLLGWAFGFAIFSLPVNGYVFGPCFVLIDFVYYWFHRASHVWKPLWAFHMIHHSSTYMNLSTSYRLNWFRALISPVFFLPMTCLGFPAAFIILSCGLSLVCQFFMHTRAVGKLGGLEGLIDTPSAHRVHHGSNPLYIDRNFGGVLMIWDRLFNTWQPETEKPEFGVTTGFVSNNPLVLIFKGFAHLARKKMNYKG